MAWNQNRVQNEQDQQPQAPTSQQDAQKKPEVWATIDKATEEAAKDNEYIKAASEALLQVAKDIAKDINEAHEAGELQKLPSARKREGGTYIPPLVVKVEQAVRYDKETKEEVPQFHNDGTPKYEPTITMKDANATISLIAAENVENGARLVRGSGRAWDNQVGHSVYAKLNEISGNNSFWKSTKALVNFVEAQGYVQGYERNGLSDFAYEANQYFKSNDTPRVMSKDGSKEVQDAWATYDAEYDKVILRSHTMPDAQVELNNGKNNEEAKFAVLVEFNGKGNPPTRTYIDAPSIMNEMQDTGRLHPDLADAVFQFKGWDNKMLALTADLNKQLESVGVHIGENAQTLANAWAKYDAERNSVKIYTYDIPIGVELSEYKDTPVVRASDVSEKDENGRFPEAFVKSAADVDKYLADLPQEIQNIVADYKQFDAPEQEQPKPKKNHDDMVR
ncbi:MAG: hypothetical protein IJV66_05365 [Firmicutes bacterium]|nr:hypothetical protein [Bacillota bacterium]